MTADEIKSQLLERVKQVGPAEVARRSGVSRRHLYFLDDPKLSTLIKLGHAVGLELVWREGK